MHAARPLILTFRLLALAFTLAASTASAQWQTETFTLKPGWNAIWLPLDVSHASIEELVPAQVEEVWRWNATQALTFTDIPAGAPSQTDLQWSVWRRYDPSGTNLGQIDGNYAYLIRVDPTLVSNISWPVKGVPLPPRYDWSSTGVNLVGFPIESPPSGSTRNLGRFFGFDPVLKALPATLFYNGGELSDVAPKNPLRIGNTSSFAMNRFEAYWVQATSYTEYYGPVKVDVGTAQGLDFGDEGVSVAVRLKNVVDISRNQSVTVTLTPQGSDTPPAGQGALAGAVPLLMRGPLNLATGGFDYTALATNATTQVVLAPGEEKELVFTVDRSLLGSTAGAVYASRLRITDSLNLTRIMLPVTAKTAARTGLWAGSAVIDEVDHFVINPVTRVTTSTSKAAPSLFPLRLLLHSNAAASVRFLQQAYIGIHSDGHAVAATESAFVNPSKAVSRLSSAHFPVGMDRPGTGQLGLTGTVSFTVPLDYRDPSNPFVHIYHPDHDNKDERFSPTLLPAGRESPNINRNITLTFTATNQAGFDPTWGSTTLGGTYSETVTGLRSGPISCKGQFILKRTDATPTFLVTP